MQAIAPKPASNHMQMQMLQNCFSVDSSASDMGKFTVARCLCACHRAQQSVHYVTGARDKSTGHQMDANIWPPGRITLSSCKLGLDMQICEFEPFVAAGHDQRATTMLMMILDARSGTSSWQHCRGGQLTAPWKPLIHVGQSP